MTAWEWIELSVVLAIHERQIAEHGGGTGVRDQGLLESALARPANLAAYGEPDVAALAAAHAFGIAKNHPFVDGNKRTAFVVMRLFMELHGLTLTASQEDRVRTTEALAAGTIDEDTLVAWIRSNSRPR